jgi:hypothetical protein
MTQNWFYVVYAQQDQRAARGGVRARHSLVTGQEEP